MTGDEDSDVLQYKAQNPAFPHESTGDQFFNESQFESYRALGNHIVNSAFAQQLETRPQLDRGALDAVMDEMYEAWTAPSRYTEGHFARHAEQLNRLWDELRKDSDLAYLDPQLFPAWGNGGPDPRTPVYPGQRRGLYIGQTILQLMENVYLDLHLQQELKHPDNRGWMTLFQTWAKSPQIQEAYRLSHATYGARFRKFCEQELKLPPPEAQAAGKS